MKTCSQKDCMLPAMSRYTWPGQDEGFACAACGAKLKGVAAAIGMHLQLIPLQPEDHDDGDSEAEVNDDYKGVAQG